MKKLLLVALVGFASSVFAPIAVSDAQDCVGTCQASNGFIYIQYKVPKFNNNAQQEEGWYNYGGLCECRNDGSIQLQTLYKDPLVSKYEQDGKAKGKYLTNILDEYGDNGYNVPSDLTSFYTQYFNS